MARWAGWGAGPAGAGAAGGPSRFFLAVALLGCAVVALVLYRDGKGGEALVAVAATVYFALRLFTGLGRRGSRDGT
jgi:hypothetical protein